ncbi:MAG: Na+/melibiose symporter-like protein [Chloroflexi bacterium OLB14]|nr:MAG: Na+/melibiose symporter-like protein [Chloroflexi bacterium OLB14]
MQILKFISYSLGNFANTIAYEVFQNRIKFYYVDVLGVSGAVIGTLWAIYGLWNAINDPLMGQISDRTRSRYGRRIPYVAFGAIPLGISFYFLWAPPTHSPFILAAYFLVILFIFDTLYSLTIVAYNALYITVAPTPPERINLSTVREIFSTIGSLLAFVLAPILAEKVGYLAMGAILGVVISAGYLISTIGIKEKPVSANEKSMGIFESLKAVLANKPFRWFLGANMAKEYIWVALAGQIPFWRKFALNIQGDIRFLGLNLSGGDAEAVLLGIPLILTIPVIFIWRPIIANLGYRKAWILGAFAFIPGLLIMTFASNMTTGLIGTLLIVPGLALSLLISYPVISEVIDDDAKHVGVSREGLFFGMNNGITKLSFSAEGVFFGFITGLTGFVAGSDVQTEFAIWGIRFLIGIMPIIACLIIAFCMWRYPLGRETFAKKRSSQE